MNFKVSSFKNHASAATSALDSVNSTNYEEPLNDYEHEEPKLSIEFGPFVLTHSN